MCLDRCNDNLSNGLKEIETHPSAFTAVSYEAFDLGAGAHLVDNHFADPTSALQSLGLKRLPMVKKREKKKVLF